jgi:ubiquinone/menaquinone biosynthesis C-methylase UbiE
LYGSQSYIEHFRKSGSAGVVANALLNEESRARRARKIVAVLSDFLERPRSELTCLDIGCSGGHITRLLSEQFKRTVGIDTDGPALAMAASSASAARFEQASATQMPFPDAAFDVVICNHVYEHINDQHALLAEISRVLRPGGVCYFGAGNRFVPIETHYRLPFLSWPPKPVANLYLRSLGRGREYLEKHLSYWGLRALTKRFRVHDYTPKVLADPTRLGGGDPRYASLPTRWLPERLLRLFSPVFPTYIWLLEKR